MSSQPNNDPLSAPIILDTHGSRSKHWISRLATVLDAAAPIAETRLPTICSCVVNRGSLALRLPADMSSLQPTALEHIQRLAKQQGFGLLENRRRVDIQPIIERRNCGPESIAAGLGLLLKQAGMPGSARVLSRPHTLATNKPLIPINELIPAISNAMIESEHCVLTPNQRTEKALGHGMNSIACYTGNLDSSSGPLSFSHFMSRDFRCIGYSAGDQYVVHQLIAGSSLANTELWVSQERLPHGNFRLQVFENPTSATSFSLFYRTIYLGQDIGASMDPSASTSPQIVDTHEFALG